MELSTEVFPQSMRLLEDSQIPLIINYYPFEVDKNYPSIPVSQLNQCPKCNCPVSEIFGYNTEGLVCPFCQSIFTMPANEQNKLICYQTERYVYDYSLCMIFLLDLNCSPQYMCVLKSLLVIALNSLPKEASFMIGLLYNNYVSFIRISDSQAFFIDLPITSNLFSLMNYKYLLNESSNIPIIISLLEKEAVSCENYSSEPVSIDLMKFFIPDSKNIFLKFFVFSPNYLVSKYPSRLSFDWVSPNPKNPNTIIDGLYVCYSNIDDIELQIQTMINTIVSETVSFKTQIYNYISPQFEISPKTCVIHCVRPYSSFSFNISFLWSRGPVSDVSICFVSKSIVRTLGLFSERTLVMSRKIPVTKDLFPLWRSVNPSVLFSGFKSQNTQKDFVQRLIINYNNRIKLALAGEPNNDSVFTLFPSLSWFIRFILNDNIKNLGDRIIEKEMCLVKFYPAISLWLSPDEKSGEFIPSMPFYHNKYNDFFEPIIVIDNGSSIHIFCDIEIGTSSRIASELSTRQRKRFPVPSILRHQRIGYQNYYPFSVNWSSQIKKRIDSILKSQ